MRVLPIAQFHLKKVKDNQFLKHISTTSFK